MLMHDSMGRWNAVLDESSAEWPNLFLCLMNEGRRCKNVMLPMD